MNSNIINFNSDSLKQPSKKQTQSFLQLIVFSIGNLNLAVRIEFVYKVVNRTAVHGSGLGSVGVALVDNRELTVIDLHRQFFQSSQSNEESTRGYLVILQTTTGELYGIPVVEAPVLKEVPLSLIRVLPESYRHSDTLEAASHVVIIPEANESITVFLLNVDLLLPISRKSK